MCRWLQIDEPFTNVYLSNDRLTNGVGKPVGHISSHGERIPGGDQELLSMRRNGSDVDIEGQ